MLAIPASTGSASAATSWQAIASMTTARYGLAAAADPGGHIYAIGGYGTASYLASADVYHATTNTWTSIAPMHVARYAASATTGLDGRIYVAGGYNTGDGYLNSVEAYNPAINTWT